MFSCFFCDINSGFFINITKCTQERSLFKTRFDNYLYWRWKFFFGKWQKLNCLFLFNWRQLKSCQSPVILLWPNSKKLRAITLLYVSTICLYVLWLLYKVFGVVPIYMPENKKREKRIKSVCSIRRLYKYAIICILFRNNCQVE